MRVLFSFFPHASSHLKDRIGAPLAAGAVAMGLLLGASAAQAAVVTDGPVATGITNLNVDDALYNVDFVIGTWPAVYSDPPSFDFFNDLSVADAVDAINAELNDAGVANVGESSTAGGPLFLIGYDSFDSVLEGEIVLWQAGVYATDLGGWIGDIANNPFGGSATAQQPWIWADFTVVPVTAADFPVVPVPAAVWLFGSGLLGLIGIARRKRAV